MAMPEALSEYNIDTNRVIARGVSFDLQQLNQMLEGPVKDILLDSAGKQELEELFATLPTTDFLSDELQALLEDEQIFKDWLVGEAIAEAFIIDVADCFYPWPTSRDLKNPNASPAGCDLTGFRHTDEDCQYPYSFSFGEVKTSYDKNSPPSVMNSLGVQLFNLRDDKAVKDSLVKYLARHATGKDWQHKFISAATRYLASKGADVAIYGLLVRDTKPNTDDISKRAGDLTKDCPTSTSIALYAIYLPDRSIVDLPDMLAKIIDEGD
jgi:hypothetical protein